MASAPGRQVYFLPVHPVYERTEFEDAQNHYNCPIVTSYAENIKNNVEELKDPEIRFMNPFLSFTNAGNRQQPSHGHFLRYPENGCRKCRHGRLAGTGKHAERYP
jgi:predicted nucleotide-binding protein (sugar kinase/HSP70/actin superfamily)